MLGFKLKQYFIKKRIDKFAKTTSTDSHAKTKVIKSIGIITLDNLSKEHDFSEILIQKFQRRNPKIYSFRKFSKDDVKSYKHFSEKDFNWKGHVVDTSLQSFLEEPFDLLICFFSKKNMYLEYAVRSSNASFKVGFSEVMSQVYDLEIACDPDEAAVFFDEMKKYLEILKKL